jgi:hypothetical protein
MTGKRKMGERLDKLDTGELVARCADLPEGPARLAVLDELARRGEAWAVGLAESSASKPPATGWPASTSPTAEVTRKHATPSRPRRTR